jgi:hypothetical protein
MEQLDYNRWYVEFAWESSFQCGATPMQPRYFAGIVVLQGVKGWEGSCSVPGGQK